MTAANLHGWAQRHLKLCDLVATADKCLTVILATVLISSIITICVGLYTVDSYLKKGDHLSIMILIINIIRLFVVCLTVASVNSKVCISSCAYLFKFYNYDIIEYVQCLGIIDPSIAITGLKLS